MNKREELVYDRILDAVLTECSIVCQKCKKEEKEFNTDQFYFTDRIFKKGWGYKSNKVLCNECIGKIQKK